MRAKNFSEFCTSVIELINKVNDGSYSYCYNKSDGYFYISSDCIITSSLIKEILSLVPSSTTWYIGTTLDNQCKIAFYA